MKRNVKALRRLRSVFRAAPAELVHMRDYTESAPCGTARCLIGWGWTDQKLIEMGLPNIPQGGRAFYSRRLAKFFGISVNVARHLFAFYLGRSSEQVLENNPHAITKAQVLRQLDRVIAGKPIRPYRVSP